MKRSMHRFGSLVALLALSGTAHAGDSISFVVGGHHVRIEAPRNCRSVSCVSVSIPGLYARQARPDRDHDVVAPTPAPPAVQPPVAAPIPTPPPLPVTPAPPLAAPLVTAASRPAAETVASIPPPPPLPLPAITLAAAATQPVAPPPPPPANIEAVPTAVMVPASVSAAPEPPPPVLKTAAPAVAPAPEDEPASSPRGDWQTEGRNGWVRIERCGAALCGYVLDQATGARGETVLINMKPKDDTEWTGNIYSRASGETYYARMTMKGSDTLRVEACAIGHLLCSGNDWARLSATDEKIIMSRQINAEPHS
jgi:uncharacterized protein (DUF2147 family)